MVSRIVTRSHRVVAAAIVGVLSVEAIGIAANRYGDLDAVIVLAAMRLTQIALLLACGRLPHAPAALGGPWHGPRMVRALVRGLVWSACIGGAAAAVGAVLLILGESPRAWVRIRLPESPARMGAMMVLGGIVGPVAEELFFRGVLYGYLRRWGMVVALIGSTVVFAVLHWVGMGAVPVVPAVGGILFAVSYERERHLAVPIAIHILGNLALFNLSLW